MSYDGSLKFDTSIDESGFQSGISNLGSIAKKAMGILAGVVAGGMVVLTKTSVDAVAQLEQNVGGVETLFKKSADIVIKNAEKAYTTAGLSANDYMSTVTSFSASLLQSLGQDTEKAAEYADRAIVDMSDNVNKMGTDMELIQNAYQGFAKQNYTMLDNLKLGYGGTKTEMERLVKDASKLKETQKKLGVTVDANSLSFGNIVNAISVMQESMGIAGTTSAEAATTIEGSMNSAKAAWENFLAGVTSADDLAEAFTTAGVVLAKNLGQIVPRLASTIPQFVKAFYQEITSAISENIPQGLADAAMQAIDFAVDAISTGLPKAAEAGIQIITELTNGLKESAPRITEKAGEIIGTLITGIQTSAPSLLTSAVELLASFIEGISTQLPTLIPQALQMVVTIADAIISNIPTIVNAGISLLAGLAQGIIQSLPTLIAEGPRIINDFADAIYAGLGQIVLAGLEILVSLVQGIWENRGLLLENALAILQAFINIFSLSSMVNLGKNLISSLGSGLKGAASNAVSALKGIGDRMLNAFKNGVYWSKGGTSVITALKNGLSAAKTALVRALKTIGTNALETFKAIDWKGVGTNVITGIVKGITAGIGSIVSAAKKAANNALDAAKKALGIHSPSRRFRDEVGKMMARGMGIGFEDNIPTQEMSESVEQSVNKMQKRAQRITQTSLPKVTETVRNVYNSDVGGSSDPDEPTPIYIHNEFNVSGKKLVDETTKATIKKINDKQKSENITKGVK